MVKLSVKKVLRLHAHMFDSTNWRHENNTSDTYHRLVMQPSSLEDMKTLKEKCEILCHMLRRLNLIEIMLCVRHECIVFMILISSGKQILQMHRLLQAGIMGAASYLL